jgi:uncharacterized protein YchJ
MKVGEDDPCPCGSGLSYKRCCQDEGNDTDLNSPAELLAARFNALLSGNFEQLYASYHPESPFIRQFLNCQDYVRFAAQQLSGIKLVSWQTLASRALDAQRLEQLLVMEIAVAGGRQFLYELALLVKTGAGWRYHSAQKLTGDDYPGPPDELDFHHFDSGAQKIRY